jgi:hypothetical protein
MENCNYMSLASPAHTATVVQKRRGGSGRGRDRYHPRFLAASSDRRCTCSSCVAARAERARHLIVGSKVAVTGYLHQIPQVGKIPGQRERERESMSQLGPRLLFWLALLTCCGGMMDLVARLLLRMCLLHTSLVKSRMYVLPRGFLRTPLHSWGRLERRGSDRLNIEYLPFGGCCVMIDEVVKRRVSSSSTRGVVNND